MKKGLQYMILALEAVFCVGVVVLRFLPQDIFSGMMAFPFEQIGLALRALSLSGSVGNVLAIVLYAGIGLSPFLFLAVFKNRKLFPEDILILLLSLSLFTIIYQMINPGSITMAGGFEQGMAVAKAVMGSILYSMLTGYGVLKLLRLFYNGQAEKLLQYLSLVLFLLNMLFVAVIFAGGAHEVMEAMRKMQVENSGNVHLYGINTFFVFLRFIVENLPYAMDIFLVFQAMTLLEHVKVNRYSEEAVISAKKLSKACGVTLFIVVFTGILFQVLQLFMAKQLFSVNSSLQIPLFSIAFVLACLLFTNLVNENKALKDENDSII